MEFGIGNAEFGKFKQRAEANGIGNSECGMPNGKAKGREWTKTDGREKTASLGRGKKGQEGDL